MCATVATLFFVPSVFSPSASQVPASFDEQTDHRRSDGSTSARVMAEQTDGVISMSVIEDDKQDQKRDGRDDAHARGSGEAARVPSSCWYRVCWRFAL